MLVRFNNEMVCQVLQHNRDISAHQGKYLDLRLHPERASELPEAKEWPGLGNFVEAINRCNAFRTCGCTASGITPGGYEAPFVDIAFDDPRLRTSSLVYRELSSRLLSLNGTNVAGDFVLEVCDCGATLPDGEEIISLRLWLLGKRNEAEDAFQEILAILAQQDTREYLAIANSETLILTFKNAGRLTGTFVVDHGTGSGWCYDAPDGAYSIVVKPADPLIVEVRDRGGKVGRFVIEKEGTATRVAHIDPGHHFEMTDTTVEVER